MSRVICPQCDGYGYQDFKSDGWTQSEIAEWEYDNCEDFASEYRSGRMGEACSLCHGANVVSEEQVAEWEADAEFRAEQEAERRMGC